MNNDDLLSKARDKAQRVVDGKVTAAELELARTTLLAKTGNVNAALYVVGLSGKPSDSHLIEPFLYSPECDDYGDLALKCLCRYLGLIDRYRPLIRSLIMSNSDVWFGSRMAAVFLTDLYFTDHEDSELGCRLVDILHDLNDKENGAVRDALVKLLDLKNQLEHPFPRETKEWDSDMQVISNAAVQRFGCINHFPGSRELH